MRRKRKRNEKYAENENKVLIYLNMKRKIQNIFTKFLTYVYEL